MQIAITSCGRFLLCRVFLNGCLMAFASSLASTRSANSASTYLVPLVFSRTALPSSIRPRSIRLFGVSGRNIPPTIIRNPGSAARPSEIRHPYELIFSVP
eukprot:Gb_40046 [translate_table: standard]